MGGMDIRHREEGRASNRIGGNEGALLKWTDRLVISAPDGITWGIQSLLLAGALA